MTPAELRTLRKKMGMSQSELGEKLGLTATSIGRMERGEQVIEKRTELAVRFLAEKKKK